MKRILLLVFFIVALLLMARAQEVDGNKVQDTSCVRIFEGRFFNKENNITIALNLYDTVLVVSNYEFLGKMNGYMHGTIHETWFVTSYVISENSAVLHLSNEMGSEDQTIKVTMRDSVNMLYETVGSNAIRKAVNGKWVKLPTKMNFMRQPLAALKNSQPTEVPRKFRKY